MHLAKYYIRQKAQLGLVFFFNQLILVRLTGPLWLAWCISTINSLKYTYTHLHMVVLMQLALCECTAAGGGGGGYSYMYVCIDTYLHVSHLYIHIFIPLCIICILVRKWHTIIVFIQKWPDAMNRLVMPSSVTYDLVFSASSSFREEETDPGDFPWVRRVAAGLTADFFMGREVCSSSRCAGSHDIQSGSWLVSRKLSIVTARSRTAFSCDPNMEAEEGNTAISSREQLLIAVNVCLSLCI